MLAVLQNCDFGLRVCMYTQHLVFCKLFIQSSIGGGQRLRTEAVEKSIAEFAKKVVLRSCLDNLSQGWFFCREPRFWQEASVIVWVVRFMSPLSWVMQLTICWFSGEVETYLKLSFLLIYSTLLFFLTVWVTDVDPISPVFLTDLITISIHLQGRRFSGQLHPLCASRQKRKLLS